MRELPTDWSDELCERTLNSPFKDYDLPPAETILWNKQKLTFLVLCDGRYMFLNELSGFVTEIVEPKALEDIVKLLPEPERFQTFPLIREDTETSLSKRNPKSDFCPKDWTDQYFELMTVDDPFDEYGLPPCQQVLYNETDEHYIVSCEGSFYYHFWKSDIVDKILEPRTFKDICKRLSDGTPLKTTRLVKKAADVRIGSQRPR